jgi:hypothetical protein
VRDFERRFAPEPFIGREEEAELRAIIRRAIRLHPP